MGVSLAWVGIKSATAAAVQSKLGLAETGERGDYYDFPIAGLILPNDWYLLTAKRCDHPVRSDHVLSELSIGTTVVACSIEEHVMFVRASAWSNGREVWSMQHDGNDAAVMDLAVQGSPPESFNALRERCVAQQAADGGKDNVDYVFEIPLELAKSIVGFKHDEITSEIDSESFWALRQGTTGLLTAARKPWWKIW